MNGEKTTYRQIDLAIPIIELVTSRSRFHITTINTKRHIENHAAVACSLRASTPEGLTASSGETGGVTCDGVFEAGDRPVFFLDGGLDDSWVTNAAGHALGWDGAKTGGGRVTGKVEFREEMGLEKR